MPFILLGLFLMVVITWPFIILFHELGHAIPSLIFTRDKVTIYVGSYADRKKSFPITIGRLEINFLKSLRWRGGVCISDSKVSLRQRAVIVIGGPLATLASTVIALLAIVMFDLHGAVNLILFFFIIFSAFIFFVNIIPQTRPITFYEDRAIFNDGYQLLHLRFVSRFPAQWAKAEALYNKGEYRKAADMFEHFVQMRLDDEAIYRWAFHTLALTGQSDRALLVLDRMDGRYELPPDVWTSAAIMKLGLDRVEEALTDFEKVIALTPDTPSFCNKAFALTVLGRYQEAIAIYDDVLTRDPSFAYAYANRGLARLRTGDTDGGLSDIHHALSLDPDSPYALRSLGIYHLDRKEKKEALTLFTRVKSLDPAVYEIDKLISEARK